MDFTAETRNLREAYSLCPHLYRALFIVPLFLRGSSRLIPHRCSTIICGVTLEKLLQLFSHIFLTSAVTLHQGWLCIPGHICQSLETQFIFTTEGEVLLASSRWKQWILLNIMQCAGQPIAKKNYSFSNASSGEVEKLCVMKIINLLTHLTGTVRS